MNSYYYFDSGATYCTLKQMKRQVCYYLILSDTCLSTPLKVRKAFLKKKIEYFRIDVTKFLIRTVCNRRIVGCLTRISSFLEGGSRGRGQWVAMAQLEITNCRYGDVRSLHGVPHPSHLWVNLYKKEFWNINKFGLLKLKKDLYFKNFSIPTNIFIDFRSIQDEALENQFYTSRYLHNKYIIIYINLSPNFCHVVEFSILDWMVCAGQPQMQTYLSHVFQFCGLTIIVELSVIGTQYKFPNSAQAEYPCIVRSAAWEFDVSFTNSFFCASKHITINSDGGNNVYNIIMLCRKIIVNFQL